MIYLSCLLVHTRQIDLRYKSNFRRNIRIVTAAVDFEAVNSILVHALWYCKLQSEGQPLGTYVRRSKYSTIPVCHKKIVTIFKSIGTRLFCLLVKASLFNWRENIPAPRPFSPFSSSSSNRKLRGTFAPIVRLMQIDVLRARIESRLVSAFDEPKNIVLRRKTSSISESSWSRRGSFVSLRLE